MVGGINSESLKALDPEEQKWTYKGNPTDFSEPVPAENSKIAAWKTGDKEFDGVDFHQVISADDFDRLYENGWQLKVIAKLVAGSYRFQLMPNLDASYWLRDTPERPYGTYSIHLNKSPDKKTKISVAGNEKSQITIIDPYQYVRIEMPPEASQLHIQCIFAQRWSSTCTTHRQKSKSQTCLSKMEATKVLTD